MQGQARRTHLLASTRYW